MKRKISHQAEYKNLLAAARSALKFAYAPYSHYKVGAAVLTANGKIFSGCNVENASYGLTLCAERLAVARAVSQGEKEICAVAVVSGRGKVVAPCGACRQVIFEFGKDAVILMSDSKGRMLVERISHLLPRGFHASFFR